MNKLNDLTFIKKLFDKKITVTIPAIKKSNIINIHKIKREENKKFFHVVNFYSVKKNKTRITGIIGAAHSDGSRKNVFKTIKYLHSFFNRGKLTSVNPLFYHTGQKAMFYQALKGSNLFSCITRKESIKKIIPLVAEWLIKLHKLPAPKYLKINNFDKKIFDPTDILKNKSDLIKKNRKNVEKYLKLLITKKPELKSDLIFCHGDAHPENVIISKDKKKLAFIDFTESCLSSRACDVGSFYVQLKYMSGQTFSKKQAHKFSEIFLAEYIKKSKIKNKEQFYQDLVFFQGWTALKGMLFCLIIPDRKGVVEFEKMFLKIMKKK